MYQLFIANKNYSSWSLRPWLLMTQLNIPFTEKLVVFESDNNWQRFREFAPNGRVPCLLDVDTVVWDSLGITEYLAERHQGVWPMDNTARTWARCAVAEMHSGFSRLRGHCTMNVGLRIRLHSIDTDLRRDIERIDELWRDGVQKFGGPFLAGTEFSAVDAFFAPVAFRIQTYGLPVSERAQQYAHHVLALPAMQAWQKAALEEPWRDEAHDIHAQSVGELIQDLRKSIA